jgi:hypothetical protein
MQIRFTLRPLAVDSATHPWQRRWFGSRWYWFWQLLGWGLVGGVFLLAGLSVSRPHLWVVPLSMSVGGLICSHLLRIAILRLRNRGHTWLGFGMRLFLWFPLLGAGMTGFTHGLAAFFAPELLARSTLPPLLSLCVPVVEASVLFVGWAGLYLGIAYFRGYHRAEQARLELAAAVKEAELRVLKSQINPHFLFNSLNTLRALIHQDPERARDAVTLLADILRAALTINTHPTITLRQELETLRSYLALEQLRYEERLRIHWSIDPDTLDCRLPPSVLQTLVENALKHGIAARIGGGDLTIESKLHGEILRLTVLNPGRLGQTTAQSTHIGLENSRSRLRHLCGEAASLALEQREPDLVAAVLSLPATQPIPASETAERA